MAKKFYEVVFEGKFDIICGMIEGFMLASGAKWEWYSSKEAGIETETLAEIIREWTTLRSRLHHVVMEEEFYQKLQKACAERGEMRFVKPKYIKSAREIKKASFRFTAVAFAKKYADDIQAVIASLPAGISIEGYKPVEHIDEDAKGVELYAPQHGYTFKGEGIVSGDFGGLIGFRKKLDDHPLVEVSSLKLDF